MRRSTALTAAAALLLLAAAYISIAAYVERSEEVEARRSFRDWMAKFNKTYGSIGEEEHHYAVAVYKENLRRSAGVKTSVDAAGLLNGFGDLTEQELSSIYPGLPARPADWRKMGTGGRGQAVSRFSIHRHEFGMAKPSGFVPAISICTIKTFG